MTRRRRNASAANSATPCAKPMTAPRSCVFCWRTRCFWCRWTNTATGIAITICFPICCAVGRFAQAHGADRHSAPARLSLVQRTGLARRGRGAGVACRPSRRGGESGAEPVRGATAGRAKRRHVAALENGLARQPADQHPAPDRAVQLGAGAGVSARCCRGACQPSEPFPAGTFGHRAKVDAGAMAGVERDHRPGARTSRTDDPILHRGSGEPAGQALRPAVDVPVDLVQPGDCRRRPVARPRLEP